MSSAIPIGGLRGAPDLLVGDYNILLRSESETLEAPPSPPPHCHAMPYTNPLVATACVKLQQRNKRPIRFSNERACEKRAAACGEKGAGHAGRGNLVG
eukprot:641134-Prorocentrum_minimum.AAC.3